MTPMSICVDVLALKLPACKADGRRFGDETRLIFIFIVKQAVAKPFVLGVFDLLAELLAHAPSVRRVFAPTGAIPARGDQSFSYGFDDFLVWIQYYFHFSS